MSKDTTGSYTLPILIPKEIPAAFLKPKNLFAKIFWKLIKLEVEIKNIPNPLYVQINKETNIYNLFPKYFPTKAKLGDLK